MALKYPIHTALNMYDATTQKNYTNSMIKTIIMGIAFEQVQRLNNLPNIKYKSMLDDDKDYGLIVIFKTNNLKFKIYAQVYQIIHKGYTGYVSSIENSQDKLVNECNFMDIYSSTGSIDSLSYDITMEPFDASWKIHYDYKKPNVNKSNLLGKLTAATKHDFNYYGKNTSSMVNYIYTIFKAVNRVADEVSTRNSLCVWSEMPFESFMIAYIMLNLKTYLEKKLLLVMIISDTKYNLLVSNEIELEYDVPTHNIIVRPKFTQIKMLINIADVHQFLIIYFNKKKILGDGFQHPGHSNKKK